MDTGLDRVKRHPTLRLATLRSVHKRLEVPNAGPCYDTLLLGFFVATKRQGTV